MTPSSKRVAVARGLFPVRLDESGLAMALAELAANTSSWFRIQCLYTGGEHPPGPGQVGFAASVLHCPGGGFQCG